jgi:ABC-type branched-subunit amino acid transport system ATPase component
MDKGSIVLSGTPQEIVKQSLFYTVYMGENSLEGSH